MAHVHYLRCDHCRKELPPAQCVGWFTVMPTASGDFDLDGDSRHFCTIACLSNWANSRHLVAAAC